ncbi:MAG TPA: TetR/AcrR family transcriptional regulator [Mesorhizobium sp.]|jgi:AcrR family transcriptional regulator|uniref:TetR/AcrR family transcriptional regulator n=1 Tax=Mesorhizobium sp. TaxID=1871066 RepID=UPI002DDD4792|nr:TetR/AcrR family transcriptional regulator [Mesorhizobium sp.]HEV2507530.1 TetR/AcrR family transcriptional regulator [Mesorhizobium sp.]
MPANRGDDILDAALELLATGGLQAVTTTALARVARCSKDTLYVLFENRDAILAALVGRQASQLNTALQESSNEGSPLDQLTLICTLLLKLLTSPASLAINRAALGDASGDLSRILITAGKERSAPKIMSAIEALNIKGIINTPDPFDAYRTLYGLLIGDRQILALHNAYGPAEDAETIAGRAVERLIKLYAPNPGKS